MERQRDPKTQDIIDRALGTVKKASKSGGNRSKKSQKIIDTARKTVKKASTTKKRKPKVKAKKDMFSY